VDPEIIVFREIITKREEEEEKEKKKDRN